MGQGRTFRIDLGYDGTGFAGSQRQSGVRTVQAELERAASQVCGQSAARLAFAGRTDRGVHAEGQVASGRLAWKRSAEALEAALRACTPADIAVYQVREVGAGFHARFGARSRVYRYRVWEGPAAPALLGRYVWTVRRPLDLAAMTAAAEGLIGRQDFAAFAGAGQGVPGAGAGTVRRVSQARWRIAPPSLERDDRGGRLLEFEIAADGFLAHMVRNIVGSLMPIGRGERRPAWLMELLEGRDRRLAPAPAPPHGLSLWRVDYSENDGEGVTSDADAATGTRVEGDEDILAESI